MQEKKISIAILLKSEVGEVNQKELAGTERIFIQDIPALKNQGYQIDAFARFKRIKPKINKLFYPKVLLHLAEFQRIRKFILIILEFIYNLQFLILNQKKDLLIAYSSPILALLTNKKTFIILQNEHHRFPFFKFCKKKYQKSLYLFCSRSLRDNVLKKYQLDRKNTFILYNAIDPEIFRPYPNLIKNNNKLKLLYCSAWAKEKGLDLMLQAILSLPKKLQERIQLTIASSSKLWYSDFAQQNCDYRQQIDKLLKQMIGIKLLDGVDYNAIAKIYSKNNYTLMPSVWDEPFGLVALESIACGTPVIAFNYPSTIEILHSSNAIIIDKKDYQRLASVLQKLLNMPKRNKKQHSLLTSKNQEMTSNVRIKKYTYLINTYLEN